ncbi:MAG: sensor histidine kinase [Bacteroidales bacterium]
MDSITGFFTNSKINLASLLKFSLVIIFLVVVGNIVVFFVLPFKEFTFQIFITNSIRSVLIGGSLGIGITQIIAWLDRKHPWLRNPVKRLVMQLAFTIGYSLLIIVIATMIMIYAERDRIPSEMFYGSFIFMIKTAIIFLILGMLLTSSIEFFRNWKKSVIMQEELKREQLILQYETLKSQVNPHFLFNSLNSVTSLIKTDPDKAIVFIKKLSEVFRYVLEQKDNEIVTVEAELNFIESYIYMQKIRFGDNLIVNIDVRDRNLYIIPLSLQMLIENAIKHNVISKEFPLTISILSKNDNYIAISNNLRKKPAVNTGSIGLENIKSRYRFFTSNPVIVREDEINFVVEIPVINK